MTLALLFPGQGSQAVGMGAQLADAFASARDVFAEVDEALGQKLSVLMREGPEDQLTLTENAQPALMAVVGDAVADDVRGVALGVATLVVLSFVLFPAVVVAFGASAHVLHHGHALGQHTAQLRHGVARAHQGGEGKGDRGKTDGGAGHGTPRTCGQVRRRSGSTGLTPFLERGGESGLNFSFTRWPPFRMTCVGPQHQPLETDS